MSDWARRTRTGRSGSTFRSRNLRAGSGTQKWTGGSLKAGRKASQSRRVTTLATIFLSDIKPDIGSDKTSDKNQNRPRKSNIWGAIRSLTGRWGCN